jgi:hypothetical protein
MFWQLKFVDETTLIMQKNMKFKLILLPKSGIVCTDEMF